MPPCLYCQNSARFTPRLIGNAEAAGYTTEELVHMETVHRTAVQRSNESDEAVEARLDAMLLADIRASSAALITQADQQPLIAVQ